VFSRNPDFFLIRYVYNYSTLYYIVSYTDHNYRLLLYVIYDIIYDINEDIITIYAKVSYVFFVFLVVVSPTYISTGSKMWKKMKTFSGNLKRRLHDKTQASDIVLPSCSFAHLSPFISSFRFLVPGIIQHRFLTFNLILTLKAMCIYDTGSQ